MELILTGDMIDAVEAYSIGLANHVTPKGEVLAYSQKIIIKISGKGPIAVSIAIDCINQGYVDGVDGYLKESREFGRIAETQDFREGASAFIEKRKPSFKGA